MYWGGKPLNRPRLDGLAPRVDLVYHSLKAWDLADPSEVPS